MSRSWRTESALVHTSCLPSREGSLDFEDPHDRAASGWVPSPSPSCHQGTAAQDTSWRRNVLNADMHQAHPARLTAGGGLPWRAVAPLMPLLPAALGPPPGTALGAESLSPLTLSQHSRGQALPSTEAWRRGAAGAGGADEGVADGKEGALLQRFLWFFRQGPQTPAGARSEAFSLTFLSLESWLFKTLPSGIYVAPLGLSILSWEVGEQGLSQ